MKSGIEITESKLVFTAFPSKITGLGKFCKSFDCLLDDIKFIALSPRLVLDDECLFILIVDWSKNIYILNDHVLKTEGLSDLESNFGLEPILETWEKFSYDDHYGKVDKIIYPSNHYWKNLFKSDWKLRVRQLYVPIKPKSFLGNLDFIKI
ncbi:hypothetical protein BST97_06525 [Nonlabens spongiae]|uniref:Uncharacterized protein n=1 Tax=Nonlabens spongiae TaxID=331648 RepID=A0A1W6MJN5_9FLAO|nr:hypothetical protein [Nonlabens spongiae]ARN77679.1 hypothetical protein BST97_06525 [Nonlabens spongiae]